ncbi:MULTISPECIES: DUF3037 domain-containing protein [Acidobacteriaceae]|uniref:DUF3037 domain-containing protein n=1 Tax=Acidobacteriaceae TaxID=204434 RepID=UPI00131C479E|nr:MULTISPECIES: DUF3037 domain-containing protein [Acidobacteriaceae]MDW5265703.1 DUF3037 domain-containing protein [Edaphobacter sp.]
MKERLPCEFFLIRYVPDVVKGEFTNIGVLLREAANAESAVVRFTRDWSRVRCMDADADLGLLEALEGEIAERLRMSATDPKPVLALLQDTLSNSVQISEARASLAESMPAELEQLMRMYVEPLKIKVERRRTGRAAIAGAMRTEFERAGVWGLMRKRIAASLYTRPGDPMKIDCGYRPNGIIRMFQAVSLEGDVEAAKGLAYSAPQLREGVLRVESAKLELTAVVEPLRSVSSDIEDEAMERYRFGVEAMEQQEIRVVTVSDLARVAETARVELRI